MFVKDYLNYWWVAPRMAPLVIILNDMMIPPGSTPVLDHGFVRLVASSADDLSVVNAARVSFNKRQEEMDEAGEGLIRFLMREKHATPFEHNFFSFHVRAPLFVVREWQRHRIASYNEESARYSEFDPIFYVPEYIRTQVGKPGSYTFEEMDAHKTEIARNIIENNSRQAYIQYQNLLSSGVAKEVARMTLPVNIYSSFYFSCNARSLTNFLSLRTDGNAQYEIRQYAHAIEEIFAEAMPITHKYWNEFGRNSV